MGREKTKSRVGGRFLALPHQVIDCAAYIGLSAPAKDLLTCIARQFAGANNGRLLCTLSVMKKRGWTSNDTLSRARKELEGAQFIQRTREAQMPRRAAWYGLCWLPLDYDPLMDIKPPDFLLKQFLLKGPS